MGYPLHLIDLLAKLYRKQLAEVKVARTLSEWFPVKKGVRQGCVLSPYLFNILAEMVMRETLDGFQGGLQIGGRMITNLRYADDIILLATSEAELQKLMDRLDQVSRRCSLLINIDKTKVMASDGIACRILNQCEQLAQVSTFPYLRSLITEDGECTTEFRTRLSRGQAIEASLQKIWKSHSIPISTKTRLMKARVWPVRTAMKALHSGRMKKHLEAFEMKGLRMILRVSWTAKKTNEWVLNKAGVKRELLDAVKAKKLAYYGHTMKKQGNCLEKEILQETMPGVRRRGRLRTAWIDNIKSWTGPSVEESNRMTCLLYTSPSPRD